MESENYDVAIIGSGPAGLTAAIYTARANLKTIVFAGATWGGQLMQTTEVENFPGFPEGILGPELMENMRKQAEKFGAKIVLEDAVSIIPGFKINNYEAKAVIIATGANTQWLGLENEKRLIGHGVSSCATCDAFFKNKKVAVVGGGDSACEEALYLTKFAQEVTLIVRKDALRASKIMQDRVLNNPKIKVLFNTEILDILGENQVTGIKTNTGEISLDGVFIAIGHKPNDELLKGLENTPGVFIAGDVIDTKYKQAITAAGLGAQAAMDCEKWLNQIV